SHHTDHFVLVNLTVRQSIKNRRLRCKDTKGGTAAPRLDGHVALCVGDLSVDGKHHTGKVGHLRRVVSKVGEHCLLDLLGRCPKVKEAVPDLPDLKQDRLVDDKLGRRGL